MATRMQQRRGTALTWTTANPIMAPGELGFEVDTNKFKIGDGVNTWTTLEYFTPNGAAALEGLIDGAPGFLNTLNELAAAVGDDANFFSTVSSNITAAQDNAVSIASADATAKSDQASANALQAALAYTDSEISLIPAVDLSPYSTTTQASGLYDVLGSAASAEATAKTYADSLASNYDAAGSASAAVAAVIDASPAALNTLNELAAALGDDENFSATITTELGNKQDKVPGVSGTEIGYLDGVTSSVQSQIDGKASVGSVTNAISTAASELSDHEAETTNVHGIANTANLATKSYVDSSLLNIGDLNIVLDGGGV